MAKISSNNKRILKNTVFLYARMLIVMVVSLFTVRVVLNVLGAEDYGINNVVGGVVTMFAFLTSTMISASQRFFAYSLGRKDDVMLSNYFSMSFWCYVGLILIIVILSETVGLWFVLNKLTIPEGRMTAALWVYQFAILSFAANVIAIPYNSILIAREQMNVYAIVGLIEVIAKLGVAYLLYIASFDKLVSYSFLMFITTLGISLFYVLYGTKHYKECRIRPYWDKSVFKEVLSYSGWSLFGAISGVFRSQGINILLNVFFNPVVNAARAIAFQVNNAINQFVLNFYKAVQPQITKYYASSDKSELMKLIFRSSRYCYYLILLLSLPILLEMPFILGLWLKEVPEYTILFTRLVIITAIVDSTAYPLQTATAATGNIKWFQIVTGGLLIMNLPVSWFLLKLGYPAETTMYVAIAIAIISQVSRIIFTKYLIDMPIVEYVKAVLVPMFFVSIIAVIPILLTRYFLCESILSSIFVILGSVLWSAITAYFIGIPSAERNVINKILISKIKK